VSNLKLSSGHSYKEKVLIEKENPVTKPTFETCTCKTKNLLRKRRAIQRITNDKMAFGTLFQATRALTHHIPAHHAQMILSVPGWGVVLAHIQ
jgi:hypothetical protein